MNLIEYLQTIWNCWQAKAMFSFFVTVFAAAVGEMQAPFIALCVLVVMDTATKWAAISKQTLDEQKLDASIWYGFYLAWHNGNLNSRAMRQKFATKVFAYLMLIIAVNQVTKVIPAVTLFGTDWSRFPGGFIFSFLAVTEAMSIVENLIAMGVDALKPLAGLLCMKREQMTQGAVYAEKPKDGDLK